jgi:hypothetical protein
MSLAPLSSSQIATILSEHPRGADGGCICGIDDSCACGVLHDPYALHIRVEMVREWHRAYDRALSALKGD